jgi:hypothetical protein
MNWYKKSQETFDFYKDIPKAIPVPKEETEEYKQLKERTPLVFQELLNNVHGRGEIISLFKTYNLKWKTVNNSIVVSLGDKLYSINNFDKPILKEIV